MARTLVWVILFCLLAIIIIGILRHIEVALLAGQDKVNNPTLVASYHVT